VKQTDKEQQEIDRLLLSPPYWKKTPPSRNCISLHPKVSLIQGEKGKRIEEGQTWRNVPKTVLFGHILQKKSTHPLFGAWSLLVIHVRFTPSKGSKGFKNAFKKKKPDHESVTMEKCPLNMGQLHGPWYKQSMRPYFCTILPSYSRTMFEEIFNHNRSKSYCFQVQPVTCCNRGIFRRFL
jgi:hypothetical protein